MAFCDCNQGRLPCTCLPAVTGSTPMPSCKPPRSESGLRPIAYIYTCRNPGQTALLWAWQPAPFGHGWIDVKAQPLVRLSEVEALVEAAYLRGRQDEDGQGFNESEVNAVVQELLK